MVQLFADTHPAVEELQLRLLREASPQRKLQIVAELNQLVDELALAGLRNRHPDELPERLRRRLADMLLGEELAARVLGSLD